MNSFLFVVLALLLIFLFGKDAFSLLFSIAIQFFIVLSTFVMIALGLNPFVVGIIMCSIIAWIIIYRVTDNEIKRHSSLLSCIIVLFFISAFIFAMTILSKTYGFGYESYEEINMFSYNVSINFQWIEVAVILIGLVGALVDASVSISSSLYEVYQNNKKMSQKKLFVSGMNIGKDILGTTVNTLLFAFLGESITLLVWLNGLHYSFLDLLNNKTFVSEVFKIFFSVFGCLAVIPLTAFVGSCFMKKKSFFTFLRKEFDENDNL